MAHQAPLKYIFYLASTPEKVWEGFVSRESNRIIFSGAELQADFKPGGLLAWVGAGPDGKPMTYVRGKVLRFEPPKVFQYTFAMGQNDKGSRATIELVPETEATKVTVTHDEWAEDDPTYAACADGWPRILSAEECATESRQQERSHRFAQTRRAAALESSPVRLSRRHGHANREGNSAQLSDQQWPTCGYALDL
jgi:uncharacterized protein YndB with AHSA1/START domain